MTVQEFKEKYPHLASLTGDDLWNAMESIMMEELRAYIADVALENVPTGFSLERLDKYFSDRVHILKNEYTFLLFDICNTSFLFDISNKSGEKEP